MKTQATRTFDHGELNIPLAKRQKGFHAELDRYLLDQRKARTAAHKAARRQHIALMAEATGLVETVSDARMVELGKPHGLNARQCRKQFLRCAKNAPGVTIRTMRKELGLPVIADGAQA